MTDKDQCRAAFYKWEMEAAEEEYSSRSDYAQDAFEAAWAHQSADLAALREENAKLREATAQARREALEEAAKLCHDYSIQAVITRFQWHTARQLEAAIRALTAQEQEGKV